MRVHHLNCATFCPRPAWFIAPGGGLEPGKMVCHCLLIESNDGLILVDTGLGAEDIAEPARRLGRFFPITMGARLDSEETARRQVERLGFHADDVRHIVVTHLDLDHAGGLSDFPKAKVHIHASELAAASARATVFERARYRVEQFAHGPLWVEHRVNEGEQWFGFERVRALPSVAPEVLIIPLGGHTRGHAAVAVQTPAGWLLHAGDAYFYRGEIETRSTCPPGLSMFQRLIAMNDVERRANQGRLRALAREKGREVRIFCAHDPIELERAAAAASELGGSA
jgi:glyoxylase-like metal-dependent hydrolase (beta-lactamase superfamily II)